jgi:hypothetical protein
MPHRNQLIECPEPGILFTRDNAAWAYHALKAARDAGQSIPEQDELCDELAGILFPREDRQTAQAREIHGIYGRTLEDPMPPGSGPPP